MSTAGILFVLAGLLALSAVISASETAFFSLRPWRVERLRRDRPGPGTLISEALRDPRVFVIGIIIGTELVNVAASNLVAILRRRFETPAGSDGLELASLAAATSALIVLLCDLTPKSLAVAFPEAVALRLARPLWIFFGLVRPIARPLARMTAFLTEPGRRRATSPAGPAPLSEDDFRTLVEISHREGVLRQGQTELIEAAFRLGDLRARQVMTPRTDIVALPEAASMDEAVELVRRTRHSRIPVYRTTLDDISGVIYAKDLLARRFGFEPPASVATLARPALFVPEQMRARQLVREFQARKVHVAVVVDEFGGTAGLVTLEDLLEEMVGEFSDEFDRPVRVFRKIERGLFWVRASMPLPEFNRRARARLRSEDVDTIGGYVLKLFDRVPSEGDSVIDDQFVFTVRRMRRRRILVLLVRRRREGEEPAVPRGLPPDAAGEAAGPESGPRPA